MLLFHKYQEVLAMALSFYAGIAGIIMRHRLLNSDGYFADDYPEERKKFVVDVCTCIASGLVATLLPLII
jgi:hypothetical protein